MNGFCGFMSITSSMRYCLDGARTGGLSSSSATGYLWMALAFMPFGLFFDFFDGKVARWRGKSSLMGQELDSLADLVSEMRRFYIVYACPLFGFVADMRLMQSRDG